MLYEAWLLTIGGVAVVQGFSFIWRVNKWLDWAMGIALVFAGALNLLKAWEVLTNV